MTAPSVEGRAPPRVFSKAFVALAAVFCGFVLPVAAILAADSLLKRLTPAEFGKAYLFGAFVWIVGALALASIAAGAARAFAATRTMLALIAALMLTVIVITSIYATRMWITGHSWQTQGFPIWGTGIALIISAAFIGSAFTRRGADWLIRYIRPVQRTLSAPATLLIMVAGAIILFGGSKRADTEPGLRAANAAGQGAAPAITAVRHPDIFLITIDTLTARDMSLYGYHRETTPHFERHASRFTVFDRFYANCNFTTCGVASLLSGRRPWSHRVQHMQGFFRGRAREHNLATLLDAAGYQMGAFVANPYAQPRQLGAAEAFDRAPPDYLGYVRSRIHDTLAHLGEVRAHDALYLFPFITIPTISDRLLLRHLPDWQPQAPDEQVRDALQFVDNAARSEQPLFVWLHIYPPHHPYLPPEPFRYRFNASGAADTGAEQQFTSGFFPAEMRDYVVSLRARYNENVAYADAALGRYLDALEARGKLEDAVVVVTADHGESFERGYLGHGGPLLHEPLIHIPFMIRTPGQNSGTRLAHIGEQVDLMPTLLELASIPAPNTLEGKSLMPVLRGGTLVHSDPVFAMTLEESTAFGAASRATIAMVDGDYKYVRHLGTTEHTDGLYDLQTDPQELRDLRKAEPARAAAMRKRIDSQLRRMLSRGP